MWLTAKIIIDVFFKNFSNVICVVHYFCDVLITKTRCHTYYLVIVCCWKMHLLTTWLPSCNSGKLRSQAWWILLKMWAPFDMLWEGSKLRYLDVFCNDESSRRSLNLSIQIVPKTLQHELMEHDVLDFASKPSRNQHAKSVHSSFLISRYHASVFL